MSISYTREQREHAKRKRLGLVTIAWTSPEGASCYVQGSCSPEQLKYAQYALEKFLKKGDRKP